MKPLSKIDFYIGVAIIVIAILGSAYASTQAINRKVDQLPASEYKFQLHNETERWRGEMHGTPLDKKPTPGHDF